MADQRLFPRHDGQGEAAPAPAPEPVADSRLWSERPLAARALRMAVVVVPALLALLVAGVLVRAVPRPGGAAGQAAWWLGLTVVAGAAGWGAHRLARRLLPLAALLGIALVFPGRAPRRLWVGLGAGNRKTVDARLAGLRSQGLSPDPSRAAVQAVALLAALGGRHWRTWSHAERVAHYADRLAGALGLGADDRDRLRWAALLHDMGTLALEPSLGTRARPLGHEEWREVRGHPETGAEILSPLRPWLGQWAAAVDQHHERWDGYGYPYGLQRDEIALGGRIVAVADAFEVMTAPWSYRPSMSAGAARSELLDDAGRHFDPAVVRAFADLSTARPGGGLVPYWLKSDSSPLARARGPATVLVGSAALVGLVVLAGLASDPAPERRTEVAGTVLTRPETTAAPTTPTTAAGSTGSAPTTSSTTIDVGQVPRVVTPEYAVAVTRALDRALGDAIRVLVARGGTGPEFNARLAAVYAGTELNRKQSVYQAEASRSLEAFRDPPGDPVTKVIRVIRTDPGCVVLAVERDFAPLLDPPAEPPVRGFLALAPRPGSRPATYNPTAWSIVFDGATVDGLPPTTPC